MKNSKKHGRGWSKLELLAKFREIHRENPSGLTFQITTAGRSAYPNRINRYIRDRGSVSMNSQGIRLVSYGGDSWETINYGETLGISYTLPNNTQHRLY